MALTPKQTAFINEYLIDLNATQAAIRAGYSPKNAGKIGPELLGKTRIKSEIEKRLKRREQQALITAEEVINGIRDIAFDNRAKYNDKLKAFELLGKHLKLFTDKIEEKSDTTLTVKLEGELDKWAR